MFSKLGKTALKYAQHGWLVFPCHSIISGKCSCGDENCHSPGKHPRTKNGLMDATTDEAQVSEWWERWPDANIAVRTGPESKIWVWDADLPEGPDVTKELDIPNTLIQKTGSGGYQYFFQWNGTEIHNSSKKVAPGIDIRGLSGYVILPPSNHISGNTYQWKNKEQIIKAPGWLTHLVTNTKKPAEIKTSSKSYEPSKYGQTALANEIVKLSCCPQGQRNQELNICAFSLAQLVAGGELDESTVKTALLATAVSIGLGETESTKTIESGFRSGLSKPRTAPENNTYNGNNGNNAGNVLSRKITESNAEITEITLTKGRFRGNLRGAVRDLIQEFQGSFTNQDVDRELGLTDPADKAARRQALLTLVKENYIKKDIRIVGK